MRSLRSLVEDLWDQDADPEDVEVALAEVLPDDDPQARLKAIGHPVNAAMVRAMGTDLLTVQIELDDP